MHLSKSHTNKELERIEYNLPEKNGLDHRFNGEKGQVNKLWVESFTRKHQLSLHQPEKSVCVVLLAQISNMDETGLQTVPNKLSKFSAKIGKKIVGKLVSAERGKSILQERNWSICAASSNFSKEARKTRSN